MEMEVVVVLLVLASQRPETNASSRQPREEASLLPVGTSVPLGRTHGFPQEASTVEQMGGHSKKRRATLSDVFERVDANEMG